MLLFNDHLFVWHTDQENIIGLDNIVFDIKCKNLVEL